MGIFKIGQTPEEVADLAGNDREWTDSWYDEDEDTNVLRGGSWLDSAQDCRCAARDYGGSSERDDNIGFRCARI